jgi:hypothetical protein
MPVKKKDIVVAAKDLNKVLGLEPQIDIKQDLETLKSLVLQAADLIEPEDKISKKTIALIDALQEEITMSEPEEEEEEQAEEQVQEEEDEEEEDEEEEDEEEEDEEEQAQEEEQEKAPKKAKKSIPRSKPGAKGAKKKNGSGERRDTLPTKKAIVLECLKKGATIGEMAERIVSAGIDDDYEKNYRVAKAHLRKMGFDVKKSTIEQHPIFKGEGK